MHFVKLASPFAPNLCFASLLIVRLALSLGCSFFVGSRRGVYLVCLGWGFCCVSPCVVFYGGLVYELYNFGCTVLI